MGKDILDMTQSCSFDRYAADSVCLQLRASSDCDCLIQWMKVIVVARIQTNIFFFFSVCAKYHDLCHAIMSIMLCTILDLVLYRLY